MGALLDNLTDLEVGDRCHDLSVRIPEAKRTNLPWGPSTPLGIFGPRPLGKKSEEAIIEPHGHRVAAVQIYQKLM
eukprot:1969796-Pyramimonas_sp.AAC.1